MKGGADKGGRVAFRAAMAREVALWLLVPSLGLISHTYAPVPPVLLFFLAALPWALYGLDANLNGEASPLAASFRVRRPFIIVMSVYIGYILVDQYMLAVSLRNLWGVVGSAFYALLAIGLWGGDMAVSETVSAAQAETAAGNASGCLFIRHKRKFDWAFGIAVAIYTIEAVGRYTVTWFSSEPSVYQGIYRYKFGGLMYSDSNVTGLHILLWLFFTLWWWRSLRRRGLASRRDNGRYLGLTAGWMVLLGLTLSRACWIAAVIGLFYFLMPAKGLKYMWLSLGGCLLAALCGFAVFVYPRVQYDASFISKFQIWYAFSDYWRQASWTDMLFGVGLTRSVVAMGIYAHNYLLVFLVETGIIGFSLMLGLFAILWSDSRGEGAYLLLPFAIATMSEAVMFVPELFLFLSFMMAVARQRAVRPVGFRRKEEDGGFRGDLECGPGVREDV